MPRPFYLLKEQAMLVTNKGTATCRLSISGRITEIKPSQSVFLDGATYEAYATIFPSLVAETETAVIESDTAPITKVKKDGTKNKKQRK